MTQGDNRRSAPSVDTGGGAYVGGGVQTGGGDFVGRDKIEIGPDIVRDVTGLECPYLGLRAFTYDDRQSFAGRERVVGEAVRLLTDPGAQRTLLFITGASGSGKSSFAQAGVLPALGSYYQARGCRTARAVFHPGERPVARLADALLLLGLTQNVALDPLAVIGTAAAFNSFVETGTPEGQINLVVFDQFEELFTHSDVTQREALIAILSNLAPFAYLRTHFLVTLRSDYLPDLFPLWSLYDLSKQGIDLREMNEAALGESVTRPLQAAARVDTRYRSKSWEPDLVDELVRQAALAPTYLPLLQVTLAEIWRRGHLTLGSYRRLGGTLTSSIRERATAVLEYIDYDSGQPVARRTESDRRVVLGLVLDLIQVSVEATGRPDARRRRPRSELVGEAIDPAATTRAHVLHDLVRARLLSVERQGDIDYVNLIHESLIANWDELQEILAGERLALQQRARFEQAVLSWLANNRAYSSLLAGVPLDEARVLDRRHDVALRAPDAREFFERSVARHNEALRNLSEVGWAVIFPESADPAIRAALADLLELRRQQATQLDQRFYKEFLSDDAYCPGESKQQFLNRRGIGSGPASPLTLPFYVLLVGNPEAIPYSFQYQLAAQRAVGRIHFDTPQEYAQYAASVVATETGRVTVPRRAVVFATSHRGDMASTRYGAPMGAKLAERLSIAHPDWSVQPVLGDDARKACLSRLLGGDMTPAILVTITHGMGFPNGDARQITHQGALLCQDWPGPNEWMGQPMPGEFYFASDDVGEESQLCGLIAILQATYSAGTPKLLDYANPSGRRDQERTIIAPHDFLAALPKRLLGHPKGGALAVVGQVGLSWVEPAGRASVTSAPSVPSLEIRLMEGYPVGAALETGRQAHSDLAAVVAGSLLEGTLTENAAEMRLLRQLHNARTQIIIGDPAVRLPLCGPAKAPPGRLGA